MWHCMYLFIKEGSGGRLTSPAGWMDSSRRSGPPDPAAGTCIARCIVRRSAESECRQTIMQAEGSTGVIATHSQNVTCVFAFQRISSFSSAEVPCLSDSANHLPNKKPCDEPSRSSSSDSNVSSAAPSSFTTALLFALSPTLKRSTILAAYFAMACRPTSTKSYTNVVCFASAGSASCRQSQSVHSANNKDNNCGDTTMTPNDGKG